MTTYRTRTTTTKSRRLPLTSGLLCRVACCLALALALSLPGAALADPVVFPPDAIDKLSSFDPQKGDVTALLRSVTPQLARACLNLSTDEIQKGGPLSETLGPALLGKLDAAPGSLPLVVYKKEDGKLPAAFIIARIRGATPAQIAAHLVTREGVVPHPQVNQYLELKKPTQVPEAPWPAGTVHKNATGFSAFDMPFGAGLFGLRPSYVFVNWDIVTLPNGIAITSFTDRKGTPDEHGRLATYKDKKGKEQKLEDDYYEVREDRLTSLMIPDRDQDGKLTNTILVYFVRIIPALKPGTDLVGSGALARWIFARGSAAALVTPVKLIREEVERKTGK